MVESPASQPLAIQIDTTPPRIVSYSPDGGQETPVDSLRLVFDRMGDGRAVDEGCVQLTDPSGAGVTIDRVRSILWDGGKSCEAFFAAQSLPGDYQLTVNGVVDAAGNAMGEFHRDPAFSIHSPLPDISWVDVQLETELIGDHVVLRRTYRISEADVEPDFAIRYWADTSGLLTVWQPTTLWEEVITSASDKTVGTHTRTVSFSVPVSVHTPWATLDSGNTVAESNELNNDWSGPVIVPLPGPVSETGMGTDSTRMEPLVETLLPPSASPTAGKGMDDTGRVTDAENLSAMVVHVIDGAAPKAKDDVAEAVASPNASPTVVAPVVDVKQLLSVEEGRPADGGTDDPLHAEPTTIEGHPVVAPILGPVPMSTSRDEADKGVTEDDPFKVSTNDDTAVRTFFAAVPGDYVFHFLDSFPPRSEFLPLNERQEHIEKTIDFLFTTEEY